MQTAQRPPCSSHTRTPAATTCVGCGLFLCADCGVGDRCARCKGAGHPVPWEDSTLRAPTAFLRTLKALTRTAEFHATLPWTGGLRAPITFAVTAAMIGALAAVAFTALTALVGGGAMDAMRATVLKTAPDSEVRELYRLLFDLAKGAQAAELRMAVGLALLTPLLVPIELLIMGAITHGLARSLGGQGTFEATVRAQGYAAGGQVLRVVPFVGGTLSFLAVVLLTVSGLRRAHGVTTPRALVLALWWIPVVAVFGCLFLALFVGNVLVPLLGR